MITCKVGENIINCYDGTHSKDQLKKWASKDILICPVCGKPYEYCHGEFVSPYFRHKEKDQCEDIYSESESQEHINGKRDLYEWIKNQTGVTDAVLEGWIPETKQRPDIMFKYDGKQYVIEYQCTPIASEYVERHELYQAGGIEDIWILGTAKYFNNINYNGDGEIRRIKEIEKNTSLYYDSFNKVFIKNAKYKFNVDEIYVSKSNTFKYEYIISNINKMRIIEFKDKIDIICIKLEDMVFDNKYINISQQLITFFNNQKNDVIKSEDETINCLISLINNLYQEFNCKLGWVKEDNYSGYYTNRAKTWQIDGKYDCDRYKLNIQYRIWHYNYDNDCNWSIGIDCDNNYYCSEKNSKQSMFDYVKKDVLNILNKYKNDFEVKYKNNQEELNYYKNIFKERIEKPVYLLFQDDGIVDKNIRFKFLKNYRTDRLYFINEFKNELAFLDRINADKYIFMIPKYRYYPYKLRNWENQVIDTFKSIGFNVLTKESLKEDKVNA